MLTDSAALGMSKNPDADLEVDDTSEPCPFEFTMAAVACSLGDDPQSVEQVQSFVDCPDWEASMKLEIAKHDEIGTWKLVKPLDKVNIIGCHWVFHYKHDAAGNIVKCKSRLVAQGFMQAEGIYYGETFSPTANLSAIRIIAALAAHND